MHATSRLSKKTLISAVTDKYSKLGGTVGALGQLA